MCFEVEILRYKFILYSFEGVKFYDFRFEFFYLTWASFCVGHSNIQFCMYILYGVDEYWSMLSQGVQMRLRLSSNWRLSQSHIEVTRSRMARMIIRV